MESKLDQKFLAIGIEPKKTSQILKFMNINNFSKLPHFKRVKNIAKNKNLVLVDQIPLDIKLSESKKEEKKPVRYRHIENENNFLEKLESIWSQNKKSELEFEKLKDFVIGKELYVVLIFRKHRKMVFLMSQII